MKIGIITDGLDKKILTGPANYTLNLTKSLLNICNHDFYFIHHNKKIKHPIYKKGNEIIINKYLLLSGSFLKNYNLDIVHFRRIRPFWGILNFKKIVTSSDSVWASLKSKNITEKCKKIYTKAVHWGFKKKIDFIITTSKSAKRSLVKYAKIPENKIQVIYNGVDKEIFNVMNEEEKKSFKNKYKIDYPYILHVSNYHPIKNPLTLMRTFNICKKSGLKHKLVIVGSRWKNNIIEQIIKKLDLYKHIKFFGFIEQKELSGFYNCASLLFHPSIKESFSLVLVEAMASGCPIVTANVYSIPEVVADAALKINNPKNSKLFAQKIIRVVTEESLKNQLKKKSLERAKKFKWKNTAKKTIEIYQKVLNQ